MIGGMDGWTWEYEGYDPGRERLRESLCTLGNGYVATRGATPESVAGGAHYPGTYAAGLYNRLASVVGDRQVFNEDLVNLPNWLPLRFRTGAHGGRPGPWLTPDRRTPLAYRQSLDLRHAVLTRVVRYRLARHSSLTVRQLRLVHMGEPHLAALRTEFTAQGWSGELLVESGLDGRVANTGVARYRGLSNRHLIRSHTGVQEPDTVWLRCRTSASDVRITLAGRTRVTTGDDAGRETRLTARRAAQTLTVPVADGGSAVVDKVVALHTSRDPAVSDPLAATIEEAVRAPSFDELLASHGTAWERLWRHAELRVPGEAGRILRLHLFHVLQTLSPHTAELDAGVPARGLHGEAYRGHVFWDELFVLPYLDLHFPEVSRALLGHRYRRLPRACRSAQEVGRRGAMFPWQSGTDGREETQEIHLNPLSGHWLPDYSRLQHHVGSAVAYNVWRYCEATGDTEFLHTAGAEMLVQIARFWADSAVRAAGDHRCHLRGVVGPDEYHDAYPDAGTPGIDDNAYTNVTAAWVLGRALDVVRTLPAPRRQELFERIGLEHDEPDRWEEVSRTLYVPFHSGVISQFEGYGDLAELDWAAYRARYGDIRRLDRILESEGDTPNRYQASKQADVLMLGYLFPPRELGEILERLGYPLDDATWHATLDYYLARTSHGSTLSGLVHGWVLARARRAGAWAYCQEALTGDVADIQGGTTAEGIHLGTMAGTLDLVQRGLPGLATRGDELLLDPAPMPELSQFGFTLRYRGHWDVQVHFGSGRVRITVPESEEQPIRAVLDDRAVTVAPGESRTLRLPRR